MRSGGRSACAPSGRIAAAPPRSAMNSRRLTIPSAKPKQPCVERSLAQISPALALRHRPLPSHATPGSIHGLDLAAVVDGHSAASSLPWIAKGGTLNRPAEALVAIPDPGRHYSVPVGGIISLWWVASFRYGGGHHICMMGGRRPHQQAM